MKRFLQLKTLNVFNFFEPYQVFMIARQSHRSDSFSKKISSGVDKEYLNSCCRGLDNAFGSDSFFSRNYNVIIVSVLYPDLSRNFNFRDKYKNDLIRFNVCGSDHTKDSNILACSVEDYARICGAVEEYNQYHAFIKTVIFKYQSGSTPNHYRRVAVSEETSTHIRGVDLDINEFRSFLKREISGPISEVKE